VAAEYFEWMWRSRLTFIASYNERFRINHLSPGPKIRLVTSNLKEILERFARGEISLDAAARQVNLLSYREVGKMAKLDPGRADRIGIPEAILAEGKSASDLVEIALSFLETSRAVLITRVSPEQLAALREIPLPEGACLRWEERAKAAVIAREPLKKFSGGKVGILTAGTADIPVAEEARVTAEIMGCETVAEYDVGVAGIHRLFPSLEKMMDADALVVAAGREGTLPAVVAGLMEAPVVGLPVSTGYGAGGRGEAALLSMLQSCSVMVVVNIDAGFVAGAFAARIANRSANG
jgi:NCAIR mutase (PurE)-related protein